MSHLLAYSAKARIKKLGALPCDRRLSRDVRWEFQKNRLHSHSMSHQEERVSSKGLLSSLSHLVVQTRGQSAHADWQGLERLGFEDF